MKIGCLGDIAFEVTSSKIKTIRDVSISGSSIVQSHQRHLDTTLQEFVGTNSDTITFSMRVASYLGANPQSEIDKLLQYESKGTPVLFMLGTKKYGRYRWLVTKHKITLEQYDKIGNVIGADINITLTEYAKE